MTHPMIYSSQKEVLGSAQFALQSPPGCASGPEMTVMLSDDYMLKVALVQYQHEEDKKK